MSQDLAEARDRFARPSTRHRFTARNATVARIERVAPQIIRVSVGGADFVDFASTGPADHVRVFFPDAATGELVAPSAAGPGEDGLVRPDRASISRDFTPLPRSTADGVEVDLDFFVHPDHGPASAWADAARPGDRLVLVGPRGSKGVPSGLDRLVLICDETALPATGRWAREIAAGTPVQVIAAVPGPGDWVADYLGAGPHVQVVAPDPSGQSTIAALPPIGEGVFVWAAGEASSLVGVRRHLRRTLGLGPAQAQVSGYWRRGVEAFDHHAPIDPFDPDV